MRMFYPNDTSVPVPDGTAITMVENHRSGVACAIVLRTNLIPPEVQLTSAGRNVTRLFIMADPEPVEGAERPSWVYMFSLYTQRPNHELHDTTLTCSAYSVGYESQEKSASVNMVVECMYNRHS